MKKVPEIPLGKRDRLYRFLEILPGALSYLMVGLLFIFSAISPVLGSIYLLILIAVTLVKAIGTAFRTIQGYKTLKRSLKVDWHKRLVELEKPEESYLKLKNVSSDGYHYREHIENLKKIADNPADFPKVQDVYHAVIMVAYNESLDTLVPSVQAVVDSDFSKDKIIFVFGYEERGGEEMEKNALELEKRFGKVFKKFIQVKHPDGVKGEIDGKGPNLCFAGERLYKEIEQMGIPVENVIVTSLDSDNRVHKSYLDAVAYEFITHRERQQLSYQPISIFTNNIWDAPAPSRVVAISNSFFNVITTMKPHALRNFASHSQPLLALKGMNFWSKRTIVEDGHQYWRSLFYFDGDYDVLPVRVPIYQDAVVSETLWSTIKAQFVQLRRWDYGASDVAYVGTELFSKDRTTPFWVLFPKFVRLLDGHVTCAYMAPIVAFGGFVPMLMNLSSRRMAAFNLPYIVSLIQTVALIGVIVTIWTSFKLLPKRPEKYKKKKSFEMIFQWILMPVVALLYTSLAAFYSQTRLMLGNYMEKFDVTRKVVKK